MLSYDSFYIIPLLLSFVKSFFQKSRLNLKSFTVLRLLFYKKQHPQK